ncbi:MAG: hypothetical protein ACOH5I_11895 [Oligoflexus sp.]
MSMKRPSYLVKLLPRQHSARHDGQNPIENQSFPPELVEIALTGIACHDRRDIAYLYFIENKSLASISEILRLEVSVVSRQIKQLRLIFIKTALSFLAEDPKN